MVAVERDELALEQAERLEAGLALAQQVQHDEVGQVHLVRVSVRVRVRAKARARVRVEARGWGRVR